MKLLLLMACLVSSAGAATLQWSNNSWDEDGFRIYKDGVPFAEAPADTTELKVTQPGVYYVTAYNFAGESAPSNSVTLEAAVAPTDAKITITQNETVKQPAKA